MMARSQTTAELPIVALGPGLTGAMNAAFRREWLVTNGRGGYAMGTVAEANTRRYHGLLIAALRPPLGRTLLVAKLSAAASLRDLSFVCDSNEWPDGAVSPQGYTLLESFVLEGSTPTWTYALAEARLVKRVWMVQDRDTTLVTYTHARGSDPLQLRLTILCTCRDHHALTPGGLPMSAVADGAGRARLMAPGSHPYWVACPGAQFTALNQWQPALLYREERQRGLDDTESLFAAGTLDITLAPGQTAAVTLSLEPGAQPEWQTTLAVQQARQVRLLQAPALHSQPAWIHSLALAADQFIVSRGEDGGHTIIAGYPWFADWGRDAMIAIPGLLAVGRLDEAVSILRTFARYVYQGLLPNRFPDSGDLATLLEYNTVDATLWYFHAIDCALAAGADPALIEGLYPILHDSIEWHVRGALHNIHQDDDGLLYAGDAGTQLTWMDAKIDDLVVTPRAGKPVEISALWIHALRIMARLALRLGRPADERRYAAMASQAARSFAARYWQGSYLYDVIDTPAGDDATLRPNQLIALALEPDLMPHWQARRALETCERELLAPLGLRSLAPGDPRYHGHYDGGRLARDLAYHQGTVWPWLIGSFAQAHYAIHKDARAARAYLEPFAAHLRDAGLGTISEILEGDPPHAPRGCPAQAWSVCEVLRLWLQLTGDMRR